ncbi:RnaseH [Senna tora]|uniref:RnaseH (Mitochondrion) n=1 Tax=Senna tora TaxID=362788 RepID=A0A834X1Q0_9FABA|nr:RnaseH [Senna tora]
MDATSAINLISNHVQSYLKVDGGSLTLNVDGSYCHHDGSISCGGCIRDHQGNWKTSFSRNLDKGSIFQAEMWGTILGLHLAWDNGMRAITVETNSKQVLNFINGNFDNSCQHYPLYREVIQLLARDWHVILRYVPRENNSVADKLPNFGHSLSLGTKVYQFPPAVGIVPLNEDRTKAGLGLV